MGYVIILGTRGWVKENDNKRKQRNDGDNKSYFNKFNKHVAPVWIRNMWHSLQIPQYSCCLNSLSSFHSMMNGVMAVWTNGIDTIILLTVKPLPNIEVSSHLPHVTLFFLNATGTLILSRLELGSITTATAIEGIVKVAAGMGVKDKEVTSLFNGLPQQTTNPYRS